MTTWFVSRHMGATKWAEQQGLTIDHQVNHLDIKCIKKGDIIIGTLPINLVAELNDIGARYLHLVLLLPEALRGKEISAQMMIEHGAHLQEYKVQKIESSL